MRAAYRVLASWLILAGASAGRAAAASVPTLISGQIVGAKVDVGTQAGSPTIAFRYSAPGTLGSWSFTFTSPHGTTAVLRGFTIQTPYGFGFEPPAGTAGTITFSNEASPFSLYAEPGTWTLTQAVLADLAGAARTYDAAQLSKLFTSTALTVNNAGKADFTPPVVASGRLLNRTVSLHGPLAYLGAVVELTDDLSGAYAGQLFLTQPDGKPYGGFFNAPAFNSAGTAGPAPVVKGAFQFGDGFPPTAQTGTWTITGYQVCDVAGNCLTAAGSAAVIKLFGASTFTISK